MFLSIYQIKRCYKMLTGRSVWHVNQNLGNCFAKNEVKGYYNNMTEKVLMMPELLSNNELPRLNLEGGKLICFPVAIFQYGLGAYDLYLQTKEVKYLHKFKQCVDWAIEHQDGEGRWNNFFYIFPRNPYGAMAQGEATSLLIRAYKHYEEYQFLKAAKKSIDFMLKSIDSGGVTEYSGDDVILREYTNQQTVMNGWIFAWWGLYDFVLATNDQGRYKEIMNKSLESFIKYLPNFKCRYWSVYSLDGKLASPFYHNLHIAQMQAMYQLTDLDIFNEYAMRWSKQQKNLFCKGLAFVKKVIQKIIER